MQQGQKAFRYEVTGDNLPIPSPFSIIVMASNGAVAKRGLTQQFPNGVFKLKSITEYVMQIQEHPMESVIDGETTIVAESVE